MKKDFAELKKLEKEAWDDLCRIQLKYGNRSEKAKIYLARWVAFDTACNIVFGNYYCESGQ